MVSAKGLVTNQTHDKKQVAGKTVPTMALKAMLSTDSVKERFHEMLGAKSAGFLSSVLTVVNQNALLQKATPQSILAAAATAASLDLPVLPSLARSYIVPYGNTATFIIGAKGLVELAIRSQQYKKLNVITIYEGELESWDKFAEEYKLGEQKSDKIIGFMAMFELANGFKKTIYWTEERMRKHAKRFSKTYSTTGGIWVSDFEAMSEKTILAYLLRHWGPLSVEMQRALNEDNDIKAETFNGTGVVVDSENATEAELVADEQGRTIDVETGEILNTDFTADEIEASVSE